MNILGGCLVPAKADAASGGGLKGGNHLLRAIFEKSPLLIRALRFVARMRAAIPGFTENLRLY
jgi:hypothetical protein